MGTREIVEMAEEKVRFQGRVIASVSHELKNALATVSESAGLLSDILNGSDLEDVVREESLSCSDTIREDLKRSFEIVRNLNTFAHTADEPVCDVEVVDLVDLVSTLSGYRSRARLVTVEGSKDGLVRIRTCPLLLEDLLYRVLEATSVPPRRHSPIIIGISSGEGAEITFRGLECRDPDEVVTDESRRVLDALGGGVTVDPEGAELRVRLPASIEDEERTRETSAAEGGREAGHV